jgi:lysophospholipase L1-like esterase
MRSSPRGDAETHSGDPFSPRAHAALPEQRVDAWRALHETFVREAKSAGTAGRPRCRTLFLGDSITEAMRGSQFGEVYDELVTRRVVFETWFPLREASAFGVSGDRTQHLLWRIKKGELHFRHPPGVVVVCVGTNNLGRDNDSAADTFLGIRAVVLEVLQRLPGTRVLLTGILPRGPGLAEGNNGDRAGRPLTPPAPGESAGYAEYGATRESPNTSAQSKYSQPGVHSRAIHDVNDKLKALADGSGGSVGYCDGSSAFLSPDGSEIVPETMRDALHPTSVGMNKWFAILKPAVEELRNRPAPRESWYEGARFFGDTTWNGDANRNGSLKSVDKNVRLALSRLIAWSPHALCVCDMREPDAPIVFANDNFFTQTGYDSTEVIGRNCRFLQGESTDRNVVAQMKVRHFPTQHVKTRLFYLSAGDCCPYIAIYSSCEGTVPSDCYHECLRNTMEYSISNPSYYGIQYTLSNPSYTLRPTDTFGFYTQDKIAKGSEFSGNVLNYKKNGTRLVNSLVMSPLYDTHGNVTHYIGIQRLATEDALKDAPAEYQQRAAL